MESTDNMRMIFQACSLVPIIRATCGKRGVGYGLGNQWSYLLDIGDCQSPIPL